MRRRLDRGCVAPDLTLLESTLGLSALHGLPKVLAFLDTWDPCGEGAEELASIRAELRGLGAMLIVVSRRDAWSFRPDDDIERFAAGPGLAAAIAEARAAYEVGPQTLAIFVIDEVGLIRFAHLGAVDAEEPALTTLATAVAAAGGAMTAPEGLVINRREWLLTSLVAGLTLGLAASCATRAQSTTPSTRSGEILAGSVDLVLDVNGTPR